MKFAQLTIVDVSKFGTKELHTLVVYSTLAFAPPVDFFAVIFSFFQLSFSCAFSFVTFFPTTFSIMYIMWQHRKVVYTQRKWFRHMSP